MSPTTAKFGWKDRDTAARDLLQLVYHAPESISLDALSLLEAIRSPAVVSELLDIFRDEARSDWERRYALRAVSYAPIDIYLPELSSHLHVDETLGNSYLAPFQEEILMFASRHASNRQWLADYEEEVLDYLDTLSPTEQMKQLREFTFVHRGLESFMFKLIERGMQLIEQQPELLDFDTVRWIRIYDSRERTQHWLTARQPRLIELCLTIHPAKPEELAYFLETSEALREAVFQAAPALMPIYEAAKVQIDANRARHALGVDLNYSAIWKELKFLHKRAEAGNQEALKRLKARTRAKDILEQAAAVHFFGKLKQTPGYLPTMLRLLKYPSRRYWLPPRDMPLPYIPVLFEAGEALLDQPSPEVWNALITAFFMGIGNQSHAVFLGWIAYQTDRLSGLEVEYTGETWEVERRPWFRALVEREQQTE